MPIDTKELKEELAKPYPYSGPISMGQFQVVEPLKPETNAGTFAFIQMIGDLASMQVINRDSNNICEQIARIIADNCANFKVASQTVYQIKR